MIAVILKKCWFQWATNNFRLENEETAITNIGKRNSGVKKASTPTAIEIVKKVIRIVGLVEFR